jgi:hypothetical protein
VNEKRESAGDMIERLMGRRTRKEVALAIGVSPQAVSAWIHGGSISWENCQALDDYLEAGGALFAAFGRRVTDRAASQQGGPGSDRTGGAVIQDAIRKVAQQVEALADRVAVLEEQQRVEDEQAETIEKQLVALLKRLERLEHPGGRKARPSREEPQSTTGSRQARPTPPPKTP